MQQEIQRPPSRARLNALLVANALGKPWPNVIVPVAIVAVGLVLGLALVVLPLGALTWIVLSAMTYLDEDEAEAVSRRLRERRRAQLGGQRAALDPAQLAPPIGAQVEAALHKQDRIRQAIDGAELPFAEVNDEVDGFITAMTRTAGRAQLLFDYLSENRPEGVEERLADLKGRGAPRTSTERQLEDALRQQLEVLKKMSGQLDRFFTEMERILVELDNVHGEILAASATSEAAAQQRLAEDVHGLREQVGALAQGMSEAYEEGEPGAAPA